MSKITLMIDGREVSVDPKHILLNSVILPWEYNPHNVTLWAVSNEFGILGCVWASCEQDALDELVDQNLGDGLLIEEEDATEDSTRLGNAGEPADLTYVGLWKVRLDPEKDCKLLCALAEGRGRCADTLDW